MNQVDPLRGDRGTDVQLRSDRLHRGCPLGGVVMTDLRDHAYRALGKLGKVRGRAGP